MGCDPSLPHLSKAMRFSPILSLFVLGSALVAQTTVDYPDSTLASPAGQYPLYTPTNGNVCRVQIFCPSTFASLPTIPMLCTKVGVQIAGQYPYTAFVGRAGTTTVTALTTSFTTNLPNQDIQFDWSGRTLQGGGTNTSLANVWVEIDLCHPFVYTPGQSLVVDITSQSQVAGQYCRSAIGTGVSRMYDLAYTPASTGGTVLGSGGIKLRFVFQPLYQPVEFGAGCEGTNQLTPKLSATGSTQIGATAPLLLNLSQARANAASFLVLGLQCLDLPVFGGCEIYPQLSILVGSTTSSSGTGGFPVLIPNNSALDGVAVTCQYAIDDPNTKAAPLTFTLSNGLRLVLNK